MSGGVELWPLNVKIGTQVTHGWFFHVFLFSVYEVVPNRRTDGQTDIRVGSVMRPMGRPRNKQHCRPRESLFTNLLSESVALGASVQRAIVSEWSRVVYDRIYAWCHVRPERHYDDTRVHESQDNVDENLSAWL